MGSRIPEDLFPEDPADSALSQQRRGIKAIAPLNNPERFSRSGAGTQRRFQGNMLNHSSHGSSCQGAGRYGRTLSSRFLSYPFSAPPRLSARIFSLSVSKGTCTWFRKTRCSLARERAVAQLGSALEWGSRGRGFESRQPDFSIVRKGCSLRRGSRGMVG